MNSKRYKDQSITSNAMCHLSRARVLARSGCLLLLSFFLVNKRFQAEMAFNYKQLYLLGSMFVCYAESCWNIQVVLWRKSHLSYWGHLKTKTSSLCEEKNAVYYFQKPLFVPEIFKFLQYANYPIDDVMHSTKFWWNVMKKDISANL